MYNKLQSMHVQYKTKESNMATKIAYNKCTIHTSIEKKEWNNRNKGIKVLQ